MSRYTQWFSLLLLMWGLGACDSTVDPNPSVNTSDNPYLVWRATLDLPEGSPTYIHAEATDCLDSTDDETLFACAEKQFWRVFQRDVEEREWVWNQYNALEGQISDDAAPLDRARFHFQRAQLAIAIALEQKELTLENMAEMSDDEFKLLASMSSDIARDTARSKERGAGSSAG